MSSITQSVPAGSLSPTDLSSALANAVTSSWQSQSHLNQVTKVLAAFQVVMIIFFGVFGGNITLEDDSGSRVHGTGTQGYNMFIGILIMMLVGFGYLMTFIKWYGLGAVGFTMVVTAMGLQWAVFTQSFWAQVFNDEFEEREGDDWHKVSFCIYALVDSLFAVAAVLISFGAVIGKVSPLQLVVMTIIELCCHSFNYMGILNRIGILDAGGTYIDHMFGAYFGLSVAWVLGRQSHGDPDLGTTEDIFSLIGTAFLWVYWPSFVTGALDADSVAQERGIVNTILSLSSSTITAFVLSSYLSPNGKFRPVDIQNATLAGGVAVGCTAALVLSPLGAICVGTAASLVSTYGFNKILPWLDAKGLHDTCGVHNLHGMPSVTGAVASVILTAIREGQGHSEADGYKKHQWGRQLGGIFACVAFAIATGLITGKILSFIKPKEVPDFQDNQWWTVASDYGSEGQKLVALKQDTSLTGPNSAAAAAPAVVQLVRPGGAESLDNSLRRGKGPIANRDPLDASLNRATKQTTTASSLVDVKHLENTL